MQGGAVCFFRMRSCEKVEKMLLLASPLIHYQFPDCASQFLTVRLSVPGLTAAQRPAVHNRRLLPAASVHV